MIRMNKSTGQKKVEWWHSNKPDSREMKKYRKLSLNYSSYHLLPLLTDPMSARMGPSGGKHVYTTKCKISFRLNPVSCNLLS